MPRIALALLTGFVLAGCHGSESCRLRHENAQLRQENATLRAETKKLIEENQALTRALRDEDDDDDDDDDDGNIVDVELVETPKGNRQARDLMDPLPSASGSGRAATPVQMIQDAQDAYVHGNYELAILYAMQASAKESQKAYRLIGASHCFRKDAARAKEAAAKLDAQGKQFIKYVCSRNGLAL